MSAVISTVLLAAGVLVAVASSVGALLVRDLLDRMHLLTPVTSVAGPLVGASLAVADGWSVATGQVLVVVGILAVTGPVLQAATGRLVASLGGDLPGRGAGESGR